MKKLIIFLIILSVQSVFAQWEATNWKSDPLTSEVYPSGDTIIIVEEKAFISYDKGVSWEPFFKDSEEIPFYSLLISNNNIFLRSENKGLLFSSDFGKTWEERSNEPFVKYAPLIFLNGDFLWGTSYEGVYLSTDFGKSWVLKNNGLPNSDKLHINTVAFNNDKIFLGTWNGVYISSDMGENWILKNNGLPEYPAPSFIVFNKTGSIFLILEDTSEGYNKFFVSNDNGETWTEKDNKIVDRYYRIDYTSLHDTIIVQAGENLYITDDFGDNWRKLNQFKDDEWEPYSLKSSGSDLYIILSGLLYKSTDLGESWIELKPKKFKYGMVNSMAMVKDRLIVASDSYDGSLNPQCLYTSTDFGEFWKNKCPNNIYDSSKYIENEKMAVHEDIIFFSSNAGLFKSDDFGESWEEIKSELDLYSTSFAFKGDTIFTANPMSSKFNMSPDLGKTWQIPDTVGFMGQRGIISIVLNDNYLFAWIHEYGRDYESDSLFKTSNLGKNWISANEGLPEDSYFTELFSYKNNLYLSLWKSGSLNVRGIYFSSNLGETWELRNNGLPSYPEANSFYGVGNTVFAVISGDWGNPGGIYTTTDQGLNWIKQSDGIKNIRISCFAHNDEYIFAGTNSGRTGTYGDVIYKAKLSDFGITDVVENIKMSELNIYPNPAEDYIEISPNKGLQPLVQNEEVQIFDVLGIEIISTPSLLDTPQEGNFRIDISNLPAGVYFVRIGYRVEKFVKI